MPNFCANKLKIDGSDADVEKFMQDNMEDDQLFFAKSCPEPEYEGEEDWYDWRIENWGTHDDPEWTNILEENNIQFSTDSRPPCKWLQKVANKYPSLSFSLRFAEEQNGFSGIITYVDGVGWYKEGDYGVYYGDRYCENCEECITWECCDTDWKHEFDMCTNCFVKKN